MQTRAIDVATALLVATSALCCSVVVGCAFLLVVGAADAEIAPRGGERADWSAAAALACASVAALIALTRAAGGLRPTALGVAWALAFAWPLSGSLLAGALIATLGTGLAVAWGADGAGGRAGARTAAWLAAAALGLMIAAFAAAPDEGAAHRPPAEAGAPAAPAGSTSPVILGARLPVVHRGASPASTVRAYYRALDRRDFSRAWRSLSPSVRASFGGLERWSAGFAATLSSTPSELRVASAGDDATVSLVLEARDRAACGVLVRQFSVRWRLRRTDGAWRASALSARPLGAPFACG